MYRVPFTILYDCYDDFLIRNIEKPFVYGSFSIFSVCDPVGIQTQDLQNRNLTLYSAKLLSRYFRCVIPLGFKPKTFRTGI